MRIPVGCLIAALAMLVVACGGEQEIISQEEVALRAETPTPSADEDKVTSQAGTLEACAPVDVPPPASTPDKNSPLPNPEAGLSDAERMARHERLSKESRVRMTAWLECLDFSKLDLRSLPRDQSLAQYLAGEPTLAGAVAKADVVIVGNVDGVSWTPSIGLQATLSIEQTLKGAPASSVIVTQGAGLQPSETWVDPPTLVESPANATLFPGDRAILLLQKTSLGYEIQSFSGWFQVLDGVVQPNPLNPWGASVQEMPEAEFVQQLTVALE